MRGFVEHQRARLPGEQREALASSDRARGQEALEHEAVGAEPGHRQCRHRRARPGQRRHAYAGGVRGRDQHTARIAEQRRAGIAHQRQALAGGHARGQGLGAGALVVLVQRLQRAADAVMGKQAAAVAGVLGEHRVHLAQGVQRTRRDVGQVADGSRHHQQLAGLR